jgi:hypothetical protein
MSKPSKLYFLAIFLVVIGIAILTRHANLILIILFALIGVWFRYYYKD